MLAYILDVEGKPQHILALLYNPCTASTVNPSQATQQNGFEAYIVLFPTQFSISWEYIPDY